MDWERNNEMLNKKLNETIASLEKNISNVGSVIPALRQSAYEELDGLSSETIETFGVGITALKNYDMDRQMDPMERAKGIRTVLKQFLLFGNPCLNSEKKSKLFISHATDDARYVSGLVELLEYIGFRKETMFCSSYAGYGVPLDEDIYDYLKKQFNEYELYVILMLSDNYYRSPACLNEMGAAWVLGTKHTAILLPGFDFKKIKGAVNARRVSIKIDQIDSYDLKDKLSQLREKLASGFGLEDFDVEQWERKRDKFISCFVEKN